MWSRRISYLRQDSKEIVGIDLNRRKIKTAIKVYEVKCAEQLVNKSVKGQIEK